ncbi:uncharacterized protein LOC112501945 [Cynara cardunculus var. scolymus]|uniref:uncharacterized protein LOC112501945 n=1 Tax=Cynara cardunculus var. scolymus TaxID=59895 RepID=UPI000D6296FD|nr:uncharacterized protein LOC112501945 [Cynara cardunculus var. scolymus]
MAGVVVVGTTLMAIHHRTLKPTPLPLSISQFNLQYPSLRFNLPRPASIMSATAATPNAALIHQHSTLECWSEFARNISGEWDGFGADFTLDGKPIELPENVVPDAYRDWEVKVFDWQTQCPTLAQPDNSNAIYKLIKLLPTVGCEADAATRFSIDERSIGGTDNMVSAFAYQSTGCYTAVWSTGSSRVFELEHCLIDPRDKESRVRIIQIIGVDENKRLVLKNIKVFVEQWYGPFRNGDQLGGCAIRDSAFASTQALQSSQVSGVWQCSSSKASFQDSSNSFLQQLIKVDGVEKLVRDEEHVVLLPKNLWSSVKETEDGENIWCEVGWVLEAGHGITSKCIFSRNAELKEIVTSLEASSPGSGV